MTLSDNLRGAAFMTGSMVCFTANDAFLKALSGHLPLFQTLFLRSIAALILLSLLARAMRQFTLKISREDRKRLAMRTVTEIAAAFFFISALFNMPIANVSAILQALPLTVTLAAAVFLHEAVGWRRLSAILIGLVGVLIIIRPGGDGFSLFSLYAVGAVVAVTARDLIARQMSSALPSTMAAVVTATGLLIFSGLASVFETWKPVTGEALLYLAGSALFIMGGYVFSVSAMRSGEIGFVTQFRYSSLLTALILGFLFFNEWPDALTLVGAGIVVATGLFTLYRERRQSVREKQGSPALRLR